MAFWLYIGDARYQSGHTPFLTGKRYKKRQLIPTDLSRVSGAVFFAGIFRLTRGGIGWLFFNRPVPVCDHFF
jgi:hypothetical protein